MSATNKLHAILRKVSVVALVGTFVLMVGGGFALSHIDEHSCAAYFIAGAVLLFGTTLGLCIFIAGVSVLFDDRASRPKPEGKP